MTMLTVRNVTVRAGSRTLIDGVGVEVAASEIVAIIGPNGAGKTTLLEAMLGLRRTSAGSVLLDGAPLDTFAARAKVFAYLPDAAELPSELDVRAVVDHALAHRSRPKALVDSVRERLGIATLLDAPCGVLSRGEKQRIALFVALAVERPVVVLDEPFNAFDPLQLRDVLAAVKQVADSGARLIASVHQLGDAEKIANRFLLLAEGRRVAWGGLESLRAEAKLPAGSLEEIFLALLRGRTHAA